MFVPTQFDFDFEQMRIDSEYHMIIRYYLDELKSLLESELNEFVNVGHSNSLKIDDGLLIPEYETNDVDSIVYSTYDKSTEIILYIRNNNIIVSKFKCVDLTYDIVNDFLNSFIARVRRLYDIRKVQCPDIKNQLLREWIEKNGGRVNEREYKDGEASLSMVFDGKKEIDGEVIIDSVFMPEKYDINSRRKTFKYVVDKVVYIIVLRIEKHIKQIVKVKIDSDYDKCKDEYVGSILFMSYSGEVLNIEFLVNKVNIIISDKINDANVFLDNNISEIINLAKYFVDVDIICVRSVINDDVVSWCEESGFNREDVSEKNWYSYTFVLSKYNDINNVRKHPYKTLILSVLMYECEMTPTVSAYASLINYELEELNCHKWIQAIENNNHFSKYENHCRELKVAQSKGKNCQYVVTVKDELDNFIVTDNINVTSSDSNITLCIDNSIDYIVIRACKTVRTVVICNSNRELLLLLLLPGCDYLDIVYDVKNNKYVSDSSDIKEMVVK